MRDADITPMTADEFASWAVEARKQRFAYDEREVKLRIVAFVEDLQRRLDARAVDLGRLTQTNVDSIKKLEAERNAADAVIRRLAGFGDGAYLIDTPDWGPTRLTWRPWDSRTHFEEMTEPEREAIERARRR